MDRRTNCDESDGKRVNAENDNSEVATILYRYVKELSMQKYESELRRQESIIQQANAVLTSCSILSAALFMIIPVLLQYCEKLTRRYIFIMTSSIVIMLLIDMLFASLSQMRIKYSNLPSIKELHIFVKENWKKSATEPQQLKQWVLLMEDVEASLTRKNDILVKMLIAARVSFVVTLIIIVLWFFKGVGYYL